MKNKMLTNSQSATEPKKQKQKLSKQVEQNRITEMKIIWRVINGEREGVNEGGKVQGIRIIIGRHKIDRGRLRILSIGNGEAKELICTTHGHELGWGDVGVWRAEWG